MVLRLTSSQSVAPANRTDAWGSRCKAGALVIMERSTKEACLLGLYNKYGQAARHPDSAHRQPTPLQPFAS
jgi:hypothetical protein